MTADKWTDEALERLEKRIKREYAQASKDLQEKADRYFNGYDEIIDGKKVHHAGMYERLAKEVQAYSDGKYDDKQWKAYLLSQLGRGEHWNELKQQMTERLAQSQEIAKNYSNGILPSVYCRNSNEIASLAQSSAMEQGVTGVKFDLVDEHTVKRLMEKASEVKPYKPIAINLPKQNSWNMNNLQNALLQGILQGDSIGHLADRFQSVANMNRAQAIRSARTAVTGAQSAGKQDRYEDLASKGCQVTKIWVATNDERTRPEHAEADGQEVPYNEPFEVGGEELMHPADQSGSAWNIYNCRCTMKTGKIKFKSVLSDEKRASAKIKVT